MRLNLEDQKVQVERKEKDREVEEGGRTAEVGRGLEAERDVQIAEIESPEVEIGIVGQRVEIEGLLLEIGGLKVEKRDQEAEADGL